MHAVLVIKITKGGEIDPLTMPQVLNYLVKQKNTSSLERALEVFIGKAVRLKRRQPRVLFIR